MFPKKTYIERRKVLKENLKTGLVLLLGHEEAPMNYKDNPYHFRQDSTFLYYFGISNASLAGIIDIDNDREIIFGDEIGIDDIVFMGPLPTIKERAEKCGVTDTRPYAELDKYVKNAINKKQHIHFIPLYRGESKIKLMELTGILPRDAEAKASIELVNAIIKQREFKTDEEVEQIEQAVDVTVDMHVAAMRIARPGMIEAEVAAEVHRVALAANGNISFPIIATINGQILHNHHHENKIKEGDLFLIDAGYENKMGYAGDLSSTFPVSKKFTSQQKDIFDMTLDAHRASIDALGVGKPFRDAHVAAAKKVTEGMKSLGLFKGNTDDIVETGAYAMFFQCGTGHMMGLDIHDMENYGEVWVGYDGKPKSTMFGYKSLRLAKPLQPGHVFTVEPGIYFIPELMDLWGAEGRFKEFINYDKLKAYRDFGGIRNEEDLVMTENGARILGKKKPMTTEEVEAIRKDSY
jgi:Xaa-Pro aminopeptidase